MFFQHLGVGPDSFIKDLGTTVAGELLKPHLGYLQAVWPCLQRKLVHGLAHITGGGLLENIPRVLPAGCSIAIRRGSWPVLPVFSYMADRGGVAEPEMYRVFNMGIGMAMMTAPGEVAEVEGLIRSAGMEVYRIGEVVTGGREVALR